MNWAYLAGFTDGDGCISLEVAKRKYKYSRLRWSQKSENAKVLYDIGEFLSSQGIKISHRNYSVAIAGHKYPQTELCITNAAYTAFALENMLPYLIVKRARAELSLSWSKERLEKRAQKVAKLKLVG